MSDPDSSPAPASDVSLRLIAPADDEHVERVIRSVMTEFGAIGCGFAIEDAEVGAMHAAYQEPRTAFFVAELRGAIVGGAGIAPLQGGDPDTCELRKMYLLPDARGLGVGRSLLDRCLSAAREKGFRTCYLETLQSMAAARKLYEAFGFERIDAPLGETGHGGCDTWYARGL